MYLLIKIFGLALVQNISFSMVSRSRNRDNKSYHVISSIFSHSLWFLTFRELIVSEMNFKLFIPYILGTVIGSIYGVIISMKIEKFLGASADKHIK